VAFFHTAGAFMMLLFLIAHVYLTTAGHTPTAHIKAMITGWEEV
jgi:thiosulfate reductase cytochrome b subunit